MLMMMFKQTRATQFYHGNTVDSKLRSMSVLLHGDAAFAGQVSLHLLAVQCTYYVNDVL
jgi:2-oxoglutarate dehydrogenase complex dehydrogenase (E1) component-like enzyme